MYKYLLVVAVYMFSCNSKNHTKNNKNLNETQLEEKKMVDENIQVETLKDLEEASLNFLVSSNDSFEEKYPKILQEMDKTDERIQENRVQTILQRAILNDIKKISEFEFKDVIDKNHNTQHLVEIIQRVIKKNKTIEADLEEQCIKIEINNKIIYG